MLPKKLNLFWFPIAQAEFVLYRKALTKNKFFWTSKKGGKDLKEIRLPHWTKDELEYKY